MYRAAKSVARAGANNVLEGRRMLDGMTVDDPTTTDARSRGKLDLVETW
jgi:hypothetical protein